MFVMSCFIFQETFNNFFEQAYNKTIKRILARAAKTAYCKCYTYKEEYDLF